MKTKTLSLQFYSDPGHGWLKTPIKLLEQLEIADQISPYSYVKKPPRLLGGGRGCLSVQPGC